jgi:hypothetical protein
MITAPARCQDCFITSKDSIMKEFKFRRYQAVADSFAWTWQNNGGNCITYHHLTTLGACYTYNWDSTIMTPCTDQRCCSSYEKVCYDSNGIIVPATSINTGSKLFLNGQIKDCWEVPFNCPDGVPKCDYNLFVPYDENPCANLPCAYGAWSSDTMNINMDSLGCPDCSITIFFKYRATANCNPGYYDYNLDSCHLDTNCRNCLTLDEQTVFKYSIQALLKYGPLGVPVKGQCDSTYRIGHASCWSFNDPFEKNRFYPCTDSGCCWALYKVCRDSNNVFTYTRIDANYSNYQCPQATHPCVFICDIDPNPKISVFSNELTPIESNKHITYVTPNPSTGLIEIHINTTTKGNFFISIYDRIGNLLLEQQKEMKGEIQTIQLDLNKLNNGLYFYKIKMNDVLMDNNSFILLK